VGELLLRIGSTLHALRGRDRDLVRPWKTRAESVWGRHSLPLRSACLPMNPLGQRWRYAGTKSLAFRRNRRNVRNLAFSADS